MKNIKKYVEFLLEYDVYHDSRSKPIEISGEQSILSIIEQRAPWYFKNIDNITPIYRGLSGSRYSKKVGVEIGEMNSLMIVSPSEHKRYSRNIDNHYIEILNTSDYWSEFPKRSESIICSLSQKKAKIYGSIYRVIPLKENSEIVICPRDDVFFSFPILFDNLSKINDTRFGSLAQFNDWLNFGFGIPEDVDAEFLEGRINSIVGDLQDLDEDDYDEQDYNHEIKKFSKKLVDGDLQYDDFFYQIREWMEPQPNGFKLVNYNRNSTSLGKMNEVYTDANCLLVLESDLQKELENYGN